MLTAITHSPSPSIHSCELTYLTSQTIDFEKAKNQHQRYCQMLVECGAKVLNLDGNIEFPDSVFVEDTAIILDEIAIVTPMGIFSRQKETMLIENELAKYGSVKRIDSPARIEGGDVLRIGKNLYVGNSTRTNVQGIKALEEIVEPLGYQVFEVQVRDSLHFKTGCTALDENTLLINSQWIDAEDFEKFSVIRVPSDEPFASNILKINDTICIHSSYKKTTKIIRDLGYQVKTVDVSEFLKAEAGLTCLSLIFTTTDS